MTGPPVDRQVSYSPAYTLVPTYECFNRCTYCNFRVDPGQGEWLPLTEAAAILKALQSTPVREILILSGEVSPESRQRSAWHQHLWDLADLALELGFWPHTNAGPLSGPEMAQLREVNVSLGLMVEQTSPRLEQTVHRHAPSKGIALRLQQLEQAGELRIPFTTGMLLGIGETAAERLATLEAIGQCHRRWGHIQEVILQPHSPGANQADPLPAFALEELPALVALARQVLPPEIALQVPPNLVNQPEILLACLEAGARDLGGLSPRDEVNPAYPQPDPQALANLLAHHQWFLVPRWPVYPQHLDWLPAPLGRRLDRNPAKIISNLI